MNKINPQQRIFVQEVRGWFNRYNLNPSLRMCGDVLLIGKRFELHHLGTAYMLVDRDPASTTRGTGTLDCLLRAVVGRFTHFGMLSCNQMDKNTVRVLIAANLVTVEFLQKQLLTEYRAAIEHAQRQMNKKSRRLGLGTIISLR